jgi:hypothetical protein
MVRLKGSITMAQQKDDKQMEDMRDRPVRRGTPQGDEQPMTDMENRQNQQSLDDMDMDAANQDRAAM